MSDSITTKVMKSVSNNCRIDLTPFGFVRHAPHLFRQSDDLFHCIHFQASRWGSRDAGSFTVYLAVTSPSIYRHWSGRSFPANPATALWPIHQRLSLLFPEGKDCWWDVSATTDVTTLAAEISQHLQTYGLPFFDRFLSTSAILESLQREAALPGMPAPQIPLLRAMLFTDMDRRDEATACIAEALSKNRIPGFRGAILTVARRLNLPFDDSKVA